MGKVLRKSDIKGLVRFVRNYASILSELARFCAGVGDSKGVGGLLKEVALKINEALIEVERRWLLGDKGRGRRIIWSEEDKEKICRMYVEEGKTLKEIAEQFGVSITSVWHMLKELGVERRKRGWRLSGVNGGVGVEAGLDSLGKKLYHLYVDEGKTIREIGNKLGVSHTRAWFLLKKYGIPIRSRGRRKCLCVVCRSEK